MPATAGTLSLALLFAAPAHAAVTQSEQVMQQGQFSRASCKPDPKSPDYDACVCDADIRYPQLSGLGDRAKEDKLNGWFRSQASQAACEGDKVPAPAKGKAANEKAHASVSVHYQTTFTSAHMLAFRFTDWAYTGGAHGNGSVIGVILDLDSGKFLTPADIFGPNLKAVNDVIYKTLAAKPEEEIFRDQIEARQGLFIKDGECGGCTLTLTPQGVHVLFQTYEVAPYGAGDVDVLIPVKLISYPALKEALANSAHTALR